jgi:hypothetical protein
MSKVEVSVIPAVRTPTGRDKDMAHVRADGLRLWAYEKDGVVTVDIDTSACKKDVRVRVDDLTRFEGGRR